jgi:hypothetical protein
MRVLSDPREYLSKVGIGDFPLISGRDLAPGNLWMAAAEVNAVDALVRFP